MGGDLSPEEIFEIEQEALAETGNVLLNGCLGTLANQLGRTLRISLPEVVYGEGSDFFVMTPHSNTTDRVLFIYINFAIRERNLQGYLAMLLDMPSLVVLKGLLGSFIERATGNAR